MGLSGLVGVRINHQFAGPGPGASRRLSNAGTKAGMVLLLTARGSPLGPLRDELLLHKCAGKATGMNRRDERGGEK